MPKAGAGEVQLTYLCNQHFEESGRFAGVIVGPELYASDWYSGFHELGMHIASEMQALGYAGHFDLDAILDGSGKPSLVEINSSRTGGTFAHEFMVHRFGPDYAERITMLSQNKIHTRFKNLAELEEEIGDLLYPIGGSEQGVIPLLTSTMFQGEFGGVFLAGDVGDVKELQD